MKNVTKLLAVIFAAFVFVSCGLKTYSAEELKQFGDELKGTWTVTCTIDANGDVDTDTEEVTLETDEEIDAFIEHLATFQDGIGRDYVNDEFERLAKEADGKYKVTGVNAYTYKEGVIALNVSVEVIMSEQKYTATISFLAVKG